MIIGNEAMVVDDKTCEAMDPTDPPGSDCLLYECKQKCKIMYGSEADGNCKNSTLYCYCSYPC